MIPGIVLAAGTSTRMGRPKALLPLADGDTFLTQIVRTFFDAGVEDVVVVVGHDADAIVESLRSLERQPRIVRNADYEQGQLTSIQAGIHVVERPGVVAALVTLVDVPLVSADTVRAVIECYRRTSAPIVRPTRGDEHGHPLLMDRTVFELLRQADPAIGAKPIVRAHATPLGDLPVDDDGAFIDIDTPEDYDRVLRSLRAGR